MGNIPEFKGTDRFLIERRLGAGGFGVVYQAFDRERNGRVALKTLPQSDAEALYRFKSEFRALTDVNHPNLVTLYELMADGEQWFFTMELVNGVNFLEYVWESDLEQTYAFLPTLRSTDPSIELGWEKEIPTLENLHNRETLQLNQQPDTAAKPFTQLNLDRLRSALKQLSNGLQALHNVGKLHCDIKPSNVLITKEGRVVILDFGLALELAPHGARQSVNILGTPEYMSPEQAFGDAMTEASDWYSMGVILYEALTGALPFTGQLMELLMKKKEYDPPTAAKLVPSTPQDLDLLCRDLLRRRPQDRPNGAQILRRLGEAQPLRPTSPSTSHGLPFIGRERHLVALKEALQIAKQGRAALVRIHGRSGMGKTVLARRFLEDLQQSEQGVVLSGRCYERESVPYKALDSLVDALSRYLKRLPELEVEALMPRDILALARLFPVLRQVEAVSSGQRRVLEIPDSQELRRRAFAALRELLARLADKKLLILFIDDLQWGDIDSTALLAELLRPPDPPVCLLLCCYRSEEAESSPMLRILLPALAASNAPIELREVIVDELDEKESQALAQILLEKQQPDALSRADMIARESRGSPFFIDELVRHTIEACENAKTGPLDNVIATGETSLDNMIQARITRLSDEAQKLLEIVAVAGRPLNRALAKKATGLGAEEQIAFDELRVNRMIRATGRSGQQEVETYHNRIREISVARLSPEILRDSHSRLAMALESSNEVDPESLAMHFQGAGQNEQAAKYAIAAAADAAETLAFDRAARLYRLALEMRLQSNAGQSPDINNLRIKLGDALVSAGRGAEAAQAYLDAANEASAEQAIDLRQRAAEQMLISGHIDEGRKVMRGVLTTMGMRLAPTPRRALLSFLLNRAFIRLRGLGYRESAETEIARQQLIRIDTCWSVASGLGIVDTIRAADFQTRHLLLALKAGEPYRIARALAMEVAYCSLPGGRTQHRTEMLVQKSMSLAKRIDHPHAIALTTLTAGMAAWMIGRWKKSLELCDRAAAILRERCRSATWELDSAELFSLRSLVMLGDLNELFQRLPSRLNEAQERGDLYCATNLRTRAQYMFHLASDEPEKAQEELQSAIVRWSRRGFHLQHYFALVGKVECFIYSGEGRSAWDLINSKWPQLNRSMLQNLQSINIESLHLRARAAIAIATKTDNREEYLQRAEKDAIKLRNIGMLWGIALNYLIRAAIAKARGDREASISLLAAAEAGFEISDMTLYEAVARRRRGQLIGGERGTALVEAADAWMLNQQIKHPLRMSDMIAPGNWQ